MLKTKGTDCKILLWIDLNKLIFKQQLPVVRFILNAFLKNDGFLGWINKNDYS